MDMHLNITKYYVYVLTYVTLIKTYDVLMTGGTSNENNAYWQPP